MLCMRNVTVLRSIYLFLLNLCGRIVYGGEAIAKPHSDGLLNTSEVTRIRRINSELEIGPKEWEQLVDRHGEPAVGGGQSKYYTVREVASCITDAAEALAGDSLTAAFTSISPEPWNFMLRTAGPAGIPIYFIPLWLVGAWIRYCILFPLRLCILLWAATFFVATFAGVTTLMPKCVFKNYLRQRLICLFSSAWVASLGGIIRYHGQRPRRRPNQIYVANHTSLLDCYLLVKDYPFSFVGQRHGGLVGMIEDLLLNVQSHVWFDRSEGRDRRVVQSLLKAHVQNGQNEPMIVFPEGTCVNNEYCIMFKKGCFDLGAKVYPVAIKYTKQFSDPYWNSSQVSFVRHLIDLMTSWAVVADIYYLDPQEQQPGESATHFASRVKRMICDKADLIDVNWDGFLKRNRISPKFMAQRQKSLAAVFMRRMHLSNKSASAGNLVSMDHHSTKEAMFQNNDVTEGLLRKRVDSLKSSPLKTSSPLKSSGISASEELQKKREQRSRHLEGKPFSIRAEI
eukprot:Plantae.Rhodophyta-Purpureofilum_apyrenoidigerum.ctg26930.p1 GENE.Plantae.Rhodophyta-Purpureofilum_apyrenoidigerum.ctg26930~~Plantae.Rhodophyta-Purpureofilum_apyrenoidigerum.ctg26930.p1  ORF type:complete len:509 (-),score=51.85 Plantae.Rhodophyta-Purpureofilum_apyrenoidigerum.ctg26930:105-1631(-)